MKLSTNFDSREFACKCKCGFDRPAPQLIEALQKFRDGLSAPVSILSGCRCEKHNAKVGGVRGSFHTKGMAADIYVADVSTATLGTLAEKAGLFGGIGVYLKAGFVHVDVRPGRARWRG